jgi:hypothetical protein
MALVGIAGMWKLNRWLLERFPVITPGVYPTNVDWITFNHDAA